MQCKKDPCGDHGERNSHTRGKKFSARASGFANPGLAKVVDFVERQLDQLEGCINATFAEGTGDPRVSMMKFADLKNKATGILQSLLENPGSGDGSDRPLGEHPVGTWVCSWPLDRKARGDASTLVGYFRHFLSSVCYTRNQCWIPYVIVDRLVHTGQLILNSALADMRKLSPGLDLPTVLPDNLKASWWGLMGWTNTPRQRMLSVFGELTTMAAPPLPEIELRPDAWSDATRDALQEEESEQLWRLTENVATGRRALAAHRLDSRPDNRLSVQDEALGGRHRQRAEHRRDHRQGGQRREQSRGHPEDRPDRARRGDRRRAEAQARLAAVDENRELDARSTLVGGVETRSWGDSRILGAARPPAVLQDRETVNQLAQQCETLLQERVDTLMNDLIEERRFREREPRTSFSRSESSTTVSSPLWCPSPRQQRT